MQISTSSLKLLLEHCTDQKEFTGCCDWAQEASSYPLSQLIEMGLSFGFWRQASHCESHFKCRRASTDVWIDESMTTSIAENDMQIGFNFVWKMSYGACFSMCVLSFFEGSGYQTSSIKACSWFPHRVGEIDRSRQPMHCGVSFSAAFTRCSQIFKDPERFDTLDTENLTSTAHHVAVAPYNNTLDGNMSRTDSSAIYCPFYQWLLIYFPFFNDSYCTVADCMRRPRQTDEISFWERSLFIGVRCLDTLLILVLHQILLYESVWY